MSYYLYLVETKNEYTIHLINSLTPLMYDGINSIYEDAKNYSADNEELRLFQSLLRKIPSWNEHLIEQETHRIVKMSNKGEIVEDLIKAVIKANIMILTNTPPEKKDNVKIKHDITTQKFIHHSYIEIARNIFQNPYLFSHKHTPFELKKNQRDANDIIKKSIEQSIRKLLPMNVILQNYLGNTFENQSDDFENSIPNSDYNNLRTMLNKEQIDNEGYQFVKKSTKQFVKQSIKQPIKQSINQFIEQSNYNTNHSSNELNNINVQLNLPKQKFNLQSSDNFKTLKELTILTAPTPDTKADKIIQAKTEQAIRESDKRKSIEIKSNEIKSNEIKSNEIKPIETKSIQSTLIPISSSVEIPIQSALKSFAKSNKNITNISHNSEDDSVSYFKQLSNKNNIAEIYNNKQKIINKFNSNIVSNSDSDSDSDSNNASGSDIILSESDQNSDIKLNSDIKSESYGKIEKPNNQKQTGGAQSKSIKNQIEHKSKSNNKKDWLKYNQSDDNSSINFKSIMNDVSSIEILKTKSKNNQETKKKYFNEQNL